MSKKYDIGWVLEIALPLFILIIIAYINISSMSGIQFIFRFLYIMSLLPTLLFVAMSMKDMRFLETAKNPWLESTAVLCGCYVFFVSWVFLSVLASADENKWVQLGVTLESKILVIHFIMVVLAFIVSIATIITNNLYVSLATPICVLIALISFLSSWQSTLPIFIFSSISSFAIYKSRNSIKNNKIEIEL